jgi:hypothetical protein
MAELEGSSVPKTWRDAIPYIVWGVLILGFGLELVTALVHFQWLSAVISGSGMAGLAAMALHWNQLKPWASGISPNWVVGAFALLLLVSSLIPYIEEGRWPFIAQTRQAPPSTQAAIGGSVTSDQSVLEIVTDKTFINQIIYLDGHSYRHCNFINVTLQWDGRGFEFIHNTVSGMVVQSNNGDIAKGIFLLGILGFTKFPMVGPDGKQIQPGATFVDKVTP